MQLDKTNDRVREEAARIGDVARILWEKGWAEGSGGNISVDVNDHFPGLNADLRDYPMTPLEMKYPAIALHYIIITAKGSRMRNLAGDPGKGLCLVKISGKSDSYQVLFEDRENPLIPSSELLTHLAIHNQLAKQGQEEKAIVHTHADELIALTHDKNLQKEARLNEILLDMHTETHYFIPEGIGYVPLLEPGSQELAETSLKALNSHKVVLWEKHGCLAIGKDVDEAFDRIDIMAKAARIYLMCRTDRNEH